MLCGTALQHDNAWPHAARHTTQFLAKNNVKISLWPSMFPNLNSNKHLGTIGETCSGQSERPWKCARVVSGTQTGMGRHPSASDLQPDQIYAWEVLSSYWFSRRTYPILTCESLSRKIPSDWTFSVTISWTRSVLKSGTLTWINYKIKLDELNFFWNFAHQFNSKTNQICVSFFEQYISKYVSLSFQGDCVGLIRSQNPITS